MRESEFTVLGGSRASAARPLHIVVFIIGGLCPPACGPCVWCLPLVSRVSLSCLPALCPEKDSLSLSVSLLPQCLSLPQCISRSVSPSVSLPVQRLPLVWACSRYRVRVRVRVRAAPVSMSLETHVDAASSSYHTHTHICARAHTNTHTRLRAHTQTRECRAGYASHRPLIAAYRHRRVEQKRGWVAE